MRDARRGGSAQGGGHAHGTLKGTLQQHEWSRVLDASASVSCAACTTEKRASTGPGREISSQKATVWN